MTKINPFTRTPGVAGGAFVDMHYADEIIVNFESDLSSTVNCTQLLFRPEVRPKPV